MRRILPILIVVALWALIHVSIWPQALVSPLETYEESSGWGPRRSVMGGAGATFHDGIDLVAPLGAVVRVVAAGIVRETWLIGWHNGRYYRGHPKYGQMVRVEHPDGWYTIYAHLSAILTHEGEELIAGRSIGRLGNTGPSTGPHLHYEEQRAPVIPPSVEPESVDRAFWRGKLAGFMAAEQEAHGDE